MASANSKNTGKYILFFSILIILNFQNCSESTMKGQSMMTDQLANAQKYYKLHPDFERAFSFLTKDDLADLPVGKYEIDGDRLFAIIQKENGKSKSEAVLEAHRKYIDIQYVVSGTDEMGWRPTSACKSIESPYSEAEDIGFFKDEPQSWTKVEAGHFAIFTPDDAHAPMISSGEIHKVVIKVRKGE